VALQAILMGRYRDTGISEKEILKKIAKALAVVLSDVNSLAKQYGKRSQRKQGYRGGSSEWYDDIMMRDGGRMNGIIIYGCLCVFRFKLDLFLEGLIPLICTVVLSRFHLKKSILKSKSDLRTVLEKASNGMYVRFSRRPKPRDNDENNGASDSPVLREEKAEEGEVVGEMTLRFSAEGSVLERNDVPAGGNDLSKNLQKTLLDQTKHLEVHA